mmetsp:Transcript_40153/g.97629  ORF Transcript_40153/g.97629 Transcript_40153/m.97629 type:complete len:290 (+) Transcript_40153:2274-3143(+)
MRKGVDRTLLPSLPLGHEVGRGGPGSRPFDHVIPLLAEPHNLLLHPRAHLVVQGVHGAVGERLQRLERVLDALQVPLAALTIPALHEPEELSDNVDERERVGLLGRPSECLAAPLALREQEEQLVGRRQEALGVPIHLLRVAVDFGRLHQLGEVRRHHEGGQVHPTADRPRDDKVLDLEVLEPLANVVHEAARRFHAARLLDFGVKGLPAHRHHSKQPLRCDALLQHKGRNRLGAQGVLDAPRKALYGARRRILPLLTASASNVLQAKALERAVQLVAHHRWRALATRR